MKWIPSFSERYIYRRTNGNRPLRKCSNHFTCLASQGQSHQSIGCSAIAAARHSSVITIRSRASPRLNRLEDYLLPLVKAKHGQGRPINQQGRKAASSGFCWRFWPRRSSRPIQELRVVTGTPCVPTQGQSQPPPRSRPWRRPTLYPLCHSLALVARPASFPATSHLGESEAAEMCTADGKNYQAHLASEIFSFFLSFFSLSPFFSTNYSKAGGNW